MADQAITVKKLQLGTAKLWIVLVGVNRYLDSKIRNLQYCANDCQELAGVLGIATQQFQEAEIVALYDDGDIYPELAAVENSIRKFRSAKAEDTVLFYFSGHGYLDANNRPVLCVADTSLADLSNTSLTLDYLLKELTHCDAQRQLVWLDACQEDGQTDGNKKANPAAQLNAVLEEQSRRSYNFYAMLSCNKHQRSWEIKELQHGVFTYCLIEGLKGKAANSKNIIDADGLFYYVERTSQRIIKDLKNPLVRDISAKGMNFPPKKAYQLPANAAQSPQRIVKGGGELFFIIGIATPLKNRKALIIDKLATSIDSIRLCKLLQAKGSFEVEYRYLWQKQRWNLQQYLAKYLESSNDQTVLLYLAGKIEVNASGLYELLLDEGHRLDLHWLSRVIKTSTIKELVLIADLEATRETIPSLKEILKLKDEQPFCIITAYNSEPPNKKFLREVVKLLDDAGESDIEYRVTDLISDLQKWSKSQTEIKVKGWWGTVGIIDILSVAVQRSDNEIFTIDVCPYKSLSAFTQDDAYFFHGRGNLINRILANLRTQSFLAVVGASGSGKSSVVRAGVLPRLAAEGLTLSQSRQSQICKTWVMLPGNNPLKALAQALTPDSSLLLKGLSNAGVDHFMAWLRQQPQSISVLVIDQFEELFTLTDDQERDNFIKLIASAIAQAGDIFKVIITLRADFYDRFLRMDKIASLLEKNEALVSVNSSRLQDEQYRDIIAQPARQVGLEVESGLMAVLLEELKAGSLPLLQYALEELWHYSEDGRLTLDNYKQHIGQLGQFLSDKAEATYNNFNELQKECAKFIFLRLVFLANKKDESKQDTRRRLLKSDLIVPRYKDVLDDTLQTLIKARLVVVSGESDRQSLASGDRPSEAALSTEIQEQTAQDTVEIAHEILIDNWETLQGWIENNRDREELWKEINNDAKKWERYNQEEGYLAKSQGSLEKYEKFYIKYADEFTPSSDRFIVASIQARNKANKLAKRRQRQIIGGLTGGIVILSIAFVFALGQLRRANISEINALNINADKSLELNEEFEALLFGLKAGIRANKALNGGISKKNKFKLFEILNNVLYKLDEFNQFEGYKFAFSPDGKAIAIINKNNEIKIWNLKGELINTFTGHRKGFSKRYGIYSIKFNPSGESIITAGWDNSIKIWNINKGLIRTIEFGFPGKLTNEEAVTDIIFSKDGKFFATIDDIKNLKIWDKNGNLILDTFTLINLDSSAKKKNFSELIDNFVIEVSSDLKIFAYTFNYDDSSSKKKIFVQRLNQDKPYFIETDIEAIQELVFSPDNNSMVAIGSDKSFSLWNLDESNGKVFLQDKLGKFGEFTFSSDSTLFAYATTDNKVKLWRKNNSSVEMITSHKDDISDIFISNDNKTVISGSRNNGIIRIFKFKWNPYIRRIGIHIKINTYSEKLCNLIFDPNIKIIFSSDCRENIDLWNLDGTKVKEITSNYKDYKINSNKEIIGFKKNSNIVSISKILKSPSDDFYNIGNSEKLYTDIAFSRNQKIIASIDSENIVKFWNIESEITKEIAVNKNIVQDSLISINISPDGKILAFKSYDSGGNTKILNLNAPENNFFEIKGDYKIIFSPNSKYIASMFKGRREEEINIWNNRGKLIKTFDEVEGIQKIIFSKNSNFIAINDKDKVKIWDLEKEKWYEIHSYLDRVSKIIFSPNSQFIASSSYSGEVKFSRIDGQLISTINQHQDSVIDIAFSPNGKMIATASDDETVKLWNLKGELLNTIKINKFGLDTVAFSPDNKMLATVSRNSVIELWGVNGELLLNFDLPSRDIYDLNFISNDRIIAFYNNTSTISDDDSSKGTITLSLDLNELLSHGCDWARGYLENNPNVSEEERKICDGY